MSTKAIEEAGYRLEFEGVTVHTVVVWCDAEMAIQELGPENLAGGNWETVIGPVTNSADWWEKQIESQRRSLKARWRPPAAPAKDTPP